MFQSLESKVVSASSTLKVSHTVLQVPHCFRDQTVMCGHSNESYSAINCGPFWKLQIFFHGTIMQGCFT